MISSFQVLSEAGLNCQLLAHIILEELGLALPKSLRSRELFFDTKFTVNVFKKTLGTENLNEINFKLIKPGDIFFFSKKAEEKPMFYHLAVCIDAFAGLEPEFIHSIPKNGTPQEGVVTWKLSQFVSTKRYSFFHGVKRVGDIPKLSEGEENFLYDPI